MAIQNTRTAHLAHRLDENVERTEDSVQVLENLRPGLTVGAVSGR
jgi:hypothetical protein